MIQREPNICRQVEKVSGTESQVFLTYCVPHSRMFRMVDGDAFGKLELELRRGVVVLATLSQLRAPRYGYELRQALAERGMLIEEGTLYPLLRRLEAQDLLKSDWKTDSGSPRRYYSLNADGRKLLKKLTESWQGMNEAMGRLLKEDGQ
jgi:PadR family transcriptional regulator, regulatory protein PadR